MTCWFHLDRIIGFAVAQLLGARFDIVQQQIPFGALLLFDCRKRYGH
jgi:hypothetical protein